MKNEEAQAIKALQELTAKFEAAMEDDFNTADAVAALFEMVKLANISAKEESSALFVHTLKEEICRLCDVMGIFTERKKEMLDEEIEQMIADRQQARKNKDFAQADAIRAKLSAMGIILEDTREGVKWKRA